MGDSRCPPSIHGGYIATTVLVSLAFSLFVATAAGAAYVFLQLRAGALPLHDNLLKSVFGFDLLAATLLVTAVGVYTDASNRFLVSHEEPPHYPPPLGKMCSGWDPLVSWPLEPKVYHWR